jgi:hypothetical protein
MFKVSSVVRGEEEDKIMRKTWRKGKATAGNRVHGCCFVEVLCGKVEKQEIDCTRLR